MPTSGSAGVPEPLSVDVDDSTPVQVSVQEPVSVDDNGGSLTVDGAVTVSGGPVSVTDGGGSLTVDGTVDVGNFPSDRELEVLCDAGAANTVFLRRYNVTPAGVVTSTDTLLDGTTAYVPVGPVVVCASGGSTGDDFEIVEMCDSIPQQELWAIQQDGANYDLIETNPLDGTTTVLLNNFTTQNVNALAWVPERRRLYGRTQSGAGANNVWEIDPYAPSAAVIGTVTGLPAGTWIFGAYDPHTQRWIVGGNSLPLYGIDLNTLVAERASTFTLPAGGSGDIAFDQCGRCYVSSDGVITRYNSLFDGSPTTIATVPNNGSGFAGAGYWKDGFYVGTFSNGEVFSVNTSTGQITTGLGPIGGGTLIDFAADPRSVFTVPFHRVWNLTDGTFTDTDANGDPYTIEGEVAIGRCPWCCDCGEPGDRPYGNPVATLVTTITSGGSIVTSVSARRVLVFFEAQPGAGRDTINGSILPDTTTDTVLTFGSLDAPGHVPPLTIATPGGSGREIMVIQEF